MVFSKSKRSKQFKTSASKRMKGSIEDMDLGDQGHKSWGFEQYNFREARDAWDLGKSLALITENNKSMVEALDKGLELRKGDMNQNFPSSRRGRRKLNT